MNAFTAIAALGAGVVGYYFAEKTVRTWNDPKPLTLKEELAKEILLNRNTTTREANATWVEFDEIFNEVWEHSQIPFMLGYIPASGIGYDDICSNKILQQMPDGRYAFIDPRTKGRVLATKTDMFGWVIAYETSDTSNGDIVIWCEVGDVIHLS
jgi:hypothetical protein